MAKPISRGFHPISDKPSKVVESAAAGDSVLRRVQDMANGLIQPPQGRFLDLGDADPENFIHSMNLVAETKRRFAALPARLRAECLNDPRLLLTLVSKARQGDEDAIHTLKRYKLSVTPPKAPEPSKPSPAPVQEDLVRQAAEPPK